MDFKFSDLGAFAVMCIPTSTRDGLPHLCLVREASVFAVIDKVARFDSHADAEAFAKAKSIDAKTEDKNRVVGFAVIPWPTGCIVTNVIKVTETENFKTKIEALEPVEVPAEEKAVA